MESSRNFGALSPDSLSTESSNETMATWLADHSMQVPNTTVHLLTSVQYPTNQCCGSGMFIPNHNFSIPDPGSKRFRIPNPDPDPLTRLDSDPIRIRICNRACCGSGSGILYFLTPGSWMEKKSRAMIRNKHPGSVTLFSNVTF
jgi:hypothetical protein